MAAPLMATLSMRPTTKAPRRPNASRMYTYLPPARGWRVVSSAKQSAPRSARPAPSTHATKVSAGRPSRAATRPGVRKMPDPTVIPTTMARPSTSRRDFLSSVIKTRECAEKNEGAQRAEAGQGPVGPTRNRPTPHGEGRSPVEPATPSRTAVADRSGRPAQRSGLGRAETRSISAEPDVRPEPAPVVQRGAVAPGPQAVHEVATPVQVGLVDPRAVEEGPVDVRPEAEAKGKAEPIRH